MVLVRMKKNFSHSPVLLRETLSLLITNRDGIYVDATFGRGGHTRAILDELTDDGRVIAFDQDPTAVIYGQNTFSEEKRLQLFHASFVQLENKLLELGIHSVNGILLDLGVSSPQLDDSGRGFSFMREGILDMRMNTSAGQTAAEWLAFVSESVLAEILWKYGEERFSRKIARAVIAARGIKPIQTTTQLADIIASVTPHRFHDKHPATRSFQAIRIYINQELDVLERVLPLAMKMLSVGGRLAVISFHSLEDRLVKQFIQSQSKPPIVPRRLPIKNQAFLPKLKMLGKAVFASEAEVRANPRSRSAVLRVAEKLQ